jgi:AP-1-like factor
MIPCSYLLSSSFSLHYLLLEPRREERFRERDESLVGDLEAKIAACQQKWESDAEENERLRQQLQNAATENELLKATSTYNSGKRLIAAGATWNYIIQHPLYMRGLVDVGDVSERLKLVARCHGEGPVYEERDIVLAIERSACASSDDLI